MLKSLLRLFFYCGKVMRLRPADSRSLRSSHHPGPGLQLSIFQSTIDIII